jgi:uncharacterized membrane protein YphA (DoxX/SURF4 family)
MLQRTFSSFPSGLPGIALLAQRLLLGSLTSVQFGLILDHSLIRFSLLAIIPALAGLLLILGLVTPIASSVAFLSVLILITQHGLEGSPLGLDTPLAQVQFLLIVGSLVVLGPGAYSVDGRLFGRRQVSIGG